MYSSGVTRVLGLPCIHAPKFCICAGNGLTVQTRIEKSSQKPPRPGIEQGLEPECPLVPEAWRQSV